MFLYRQHCMWKFVFRWPACSPHHSLNNLLTLLETKAAARKPSSQSAPSRFPARGKTDLLQAPRQRKKKPSLKLGTGIWWSHQEIIFWVVSSQFCGKSWMRCKHLHTHSTYSCRWQILHLLLNKSWNWGTFVEFPDAIDFYLTFIFVFLTTGPSFYFTQRCGKRLLGSLSGRVVFRKPLRERIGWTTHSTFYWCRNNGKPMRSWKKTPEFITL